MNWINPIRKKLGKNFGIANLMIILSACQLIIFLSADLLLARNINIYSLLSFSKPLIMQGEVWRLISYIILPPAQGMFSLFISLYFQCFVGHYLEQEWDILGINLYFFLGVILTSVAGMFTGIALTDYISTSLFLAFATLFPNMQFLLFFILPIKAKYLGYVEWAFIAYSLIVQSWPYKIAVVVSLLNFFLFFGSDIFHNIKNFFRYRKQKQNFRKQIK